MSLDKTAIRISVLSIGGNILLTIVKAAAGILGNSYALIADAIESAMDILSSILIWSGLRYAVRPPDKNHPYGHGRIEPLITCGVVALLITSAVIIAYHSILNIGRPHELPASWTL